ncbi:MAG TPA: polymer-forming cytoskeletal protein [Symbiobacteriaceae bacterium]|nr:polymer-forming cytoskeletal protein [Symbiobacteriaceae bacterium]
MPVFGAAKKTADSLGYDKVQTIIGEGTEIKGTIQATGVVRIDGTLEGTILHDGDLIVGPKGRVIADIRSKGLAVAGEVRGNVETEEKLELLPGARLYGDIKCGHLVVHEGAMFHGRSLMAGETQPGTAPGN